MVKDYSRGKIYKIVCNITGKIYIGSTCEPTLARRLAKHVQDFKKWKRDSLKYHNISSFQILEGGDYYIELLEICPCTINEELLVRERFYIKSNECVNKCKNLNRTNEDKKETEKEYYKKNIDTIKEKKREYYEKNIDTIKEQRKNKITCECGSIICHVELSRHKKSLKHISYIQSLI